jgi:hypothetical protein
MSFIADPGAWAEHTFANAKLGDRKRTRRLVVSAGKIAAQPEKSFTQIFDWNELRGFYRLCDQTQANTQAVQTPHWEQTRAAMTEYPIVLILHDTTELDFTSHYALTGAGSIGDGNGNGFLQHNSLAVVPRSREILGLSYQQLHVRKPAPKKETDQQRKSRPHESDLWRKGIAASGQAPEGCCWVDVADAASDDYEVVRTARQLGHHFLLRVSQNRAVFLNAEQSRRAYLIEYARALCCQGNDRVDIPGRGGRPPRTATVSLAGAPVWIPPPRGTPQRSKQPTFAAWVIRVWEPHPPADVEEPLEWILICSLPSEKLKEVRMRRDWYGCRWLLEVYHDIEKNGCSEEQRRLAKAERLETCLAVLSLVAVRVFQLRMATESQAVCPAERIATAVEIQVMKRWLGQTQKRFTVQEFVHGVARLGGFLARKSDGNPGVRTLCRGYQRLQDMVVGYNLH